MAASIAAAVLLVSQTFLMWRRLLAYLRYFQQEAYETALLDMVHFLVEEKGLSAEDAYLLCGLAGDIRICQLVNIRLGARVVVPKEVFAST